MREKDRELRRRRQRRLKRLKKRQPVETTAGKPERAQASKRAPKKPPHAETPDSGGTATAAAPASADDAKKKPAAKKPAAKKAPAKPAEGSESAPEAPPEEPSKS